MKDNVVIIAAKRSAIGRFGGSFQNLCAVDLGEAVAKSALRADMIERCQWVAAGHVLQAGCGMNGARQVALRIGVDEKVPAATVIMVCGSGLKAVAEVHDLIIAGRASCGLALGMESMSGVPFYAAQVRWGARYGDTVLVDGISRDGLTDPNVTLPMGETAERIAELYGISREEQDEFAIMSQRRYARASAVFAEEIVSVSTKRGPVEHDEHPRPDTTIEKLASLRPAFRKSGTVTAGNASGINDGAAVVFLASEREAKRSDWAPMARIVDWAVCGCDPATMGLGPIGAIRELLSRTGWNADEIECFEINEAFAVQALACIRELGLPLEKVNPLGGAIALGHPIGCSGARILVTLVHHLRRANLRRGVASLCIGGGMGIAMAVEAFV